MSDSVANQRKMLAELHRLSTEREIAERQMRADFESATSRAQTQRSDSRQAAIMRFQMDRDTTQREYDGAVSGTKMAYETRHDIAHGEQTQGVSRIQAEFVSSQRRAKKKLSEENWEANTVFEATQNAPKLQRENEKKEIRAAQDLLSQALDRANRYLTTCRLGRLR